MAFFDKLNAVAKNLGEKAGDAIETTKLTAKISSERKLAEDELKKIGEYYYNIYLSGGDSDEGILGFCEEAKKHYDIIGEYEAELEKLKNDDNKEDIPQEEVISDIVCPSCKQTNAPGTKFCSNCGMKLE